MSVGAMDAYFCDAYVDCLAQRLQSYKNRHLPLPKAYGKRNLPTEALINPTQNLRPNWSLRMAARAVMEKENVLDLAQVASLFNPVLPAGYKLWPAVMEPMIGFDWKRLTGIGKSEYDRSSAKDKPGAKKAAARAVKKRIADTVQYRHDWIHNCGRPKMSVLTLTAAQASARVREVRALVEIVDAHIMAHREV